jgi:hypothetical protein
VVDTSSFATGLHCGAQVGGSTRCRSKDTVRSNTMSTINSIFLDIFNVFLLLLDLFGGKRD